MPRSASDVTLFPQPGLADDAERLPRRDVEGDAVDRVDGAAARPELDREVLDR